MSCDRIADVSSLNDTPVFSYACLSLVFFFFKYSLLLGNRKLYGCTLANCIALKILQEEKMVYWFVMMHLFQVTNKKRKQ